MTPDHLGEPAAPLRISISSPASRLEHHPAAPATPHDETAPETAPVSRQTTSRARDHARHHPYNPAFSLGGSHSWNNSPAHSSFDLQRELHRRHANYAVQGLGRPLPTFAEMQALKARRDAHKHNALRRTASFSHPSPEKPIPIGLEQADIDKPTQMIVKSRQDSVDDSASVSSSDSIALVNPLMRWRRKTREFWAEYLGTMMILIFGTGVDCQFFSSLSTDVSSSPRGTYLSVSFGWAIGVMSGVFVAGGISGGHLNPAVTISLATFRGFPWRKVPVYILAQILGAMTGAAIVYGLYHSTIAVYAQGQLDVTGDLATAPWFFTSTYSFLPAQVAYFNEFADTAILLLFIFAIGDSTNSPPPDGMNPFALLWIIAGVGLALGAQTAYGINPARDFGPRLALWAAGYGREVWDYRSQYWLWVEWCATIPGGLFGAFLYDLLLYQGAESPLNRPWEWHHISALFTRRKRLTPADPPFESKEKMPAAPGSAQA